MGNFIESLKRLWAWLPLLWKDRDWDYDYLLVILKFKLDRMAKCIDRNNVIEDKDKVCAEIYSVINALENFKDDPNDEWMIHYDKYHPTTEDFLENLNNPKCGIDHTDLCNKSTQRDDHNWSRIWLLLDKHCRNFWD